MNAANRKLAFNVLTEIIKLAQNGTDVMFSNHMGELIIHVGGEHYHLNPGMEYTPEGYIQHVKDCLRIGQEQRDKP